MAAILCRPQSPQCVNGCRIKLVYGDIYMYGFMKHLLGRVIQSHRILHAKYYHSIAFSKKVTDYDDCVAILIIEQVTW